MKPGSLAVRALLIVFAMAPAPALAGAKIYDMTPLLNEPDPFQPVVPPAYRPAPTTPAPRPASIARLPSPPAAAPTQMSPPAAMAPSVRSPSTAHARTASPMAPTPLLVPIGREPPSDSTLRPVGRLPAGMTPQR